jgi:hypothetical protein
MPIAIAIDTYPTNRYAIAIDTYPESDAAVQEAQVMTDG